MKQAGKRKVSKPIRFSPNPEQKRRQKNTKVATASSDVAGDMLADGCLFECDKCGSHFYNKNNRGLSADRGRVVQPCTRNVDGGEKLCLCLQCDSNYENELKEYQTSRRTNTAPRSTVRDTNDSNDFAMELVSLSNNPLVKNLVCNNPKVTCCCSYKWLRSRDDKVAEIQQLLNVMETASYFKQQKSATQSNGKVGLGNGKKRSKEYEEFVLTARQELRHKLNFCEPLTQQILGYSNNFLHKRLLTEQRRTRVGDKKSSLMPVTSLWSQKCCRDNCVMMARSHVNLIAKWRQLSQESQRGLQQAVAELLTPSAGSKINCYNFISMVTGCSTATISKVSKMLKKNCGVLGIQEHGLRKYWREKRGDDGVDSLEEDRLAAVWTLPQHSAEEIELRQTIAKQTRQLEHLKSQVANQQREIEKHKAVISNCQNKNIVREDRNNAYRAPVDSHILISTPNSNVYRSSSLTNTQATSSYYAPKTHCHIWSESDSYAGAAHLPNTCDMLGNMSTMSSSVVIATSKPTTVFRPEPSVTSMKSDGRGRHIPGVGEMSHSTIDDCADNSIHHTDGFSSHVGMHLHREFIAQLPDSKTNIRAPNVNLALMNTAFHSFDRSLTQNAQMREWARHSTGDPFIGPTTTG